ncbi:MAG: hypothetical protein WKG06_05780 [Segetibacter sp.]
MSNSFDINDLGIFAGFSFIVLLLILNFILNRKVSNLKIALNSITKRYSDDADEKCFEDFLNLQTDKIKALHAINLTRRKYHYNFLSMNEIFNVPNKFSNEGATIDKIIEIFRKKFFIYHF